LSAEQLEQLLDRQVRVREDPSKRARADLLVIWDDYASVRLSRRRVTWLPR